MESKRHNSGVGLTLASGENGFSFSINEVRSSSGTRPMVHCLALPRSISEPLAPKGNPFNLPFATGCGPRALSPARAKWRPTASDSNFS
jgi:hypothetical protein